MWRYQYRDVDGVVDILFKDANRTDIKLGQPLPYDMYDKNGMLVLKAGTVVDSEARFNQLMEAKLYMVHTGEGAVRAATFAASQRNAERKSFEMTDWQMKQLSNLFAHIKQGRAQDIFVKQVSNIATSVQESCTKDADAALACLHLGTDAPYIVQHALHAAVTVAIVSTKLDISNDKRHIMICAALTHNIGLLDVQDVLDKQQTPLSSEQKKRINDHPLDGAKMLESFGVVEPIWLNSVKQHHERLDGTGYPEKLSGSVIKIPARLLAIADVYGAMLRVRPYRKAVMSRQALRSLLVEQAGQVDRRLVEILVKTGGIFPAGVLVKLANGEVAVVKKQQHNSAAPLVYVFVKPDGEARVSPILRDTSVAEFAVQGLVALEQYQTHLSMIRGLWINS